MKRAIGLVLASLAGLILCVYEPDIAGALGPEGCSNYACMSGTPASATTATNLAAGTAGQIPYQTGAGATGFFGTCSNVQVIQGAGTGAPVCVAGVTITSMTATTTATYGVTTSSGINVQAGTLLSAAQIEATATGNNTFSIKASSGLISTGGTVSVGGLGIDVTATGNSQYSITTSSGMSMKDGTLLIAGPAQFTYANNVAFTIAASSGISIASPGVLRLSGLTVGSVPFIGTSGNVIQNNTNLFWDNTNTRLGVGTASPQTVFDVNGAFQWGSAATKSTGSATGALTIAANANVIMTEGTGEFRVGASAGHVASTEPEILLGDNNAIKFHTGANTNFGIDTQANGLIITEDLDETGAAARINFNQANNNIVTGGSGNYPLGSVVILSTSTNAETPVLNVQNQAGNAVQWAINLGGIMQHACIAAATLRTTVPPNHSATVNNTVLNCDDDDIYTSTGTAINQWRNSRTGTGP